MTKERRNRLFRRLFYFSISSLFVLITSAYLILNYWEPILSRTIKSSFYKSTNHLYQLEFDDIGFNLFIGKLSLRNIRLIPNLKVYNELKNKRKQPAYLFNLSIEKAFISQVGLLSLYNDKKLHINEISINNPSVTVINDLSYKKSASDTSLFRNPYDLISKQIRSLQVEQINLKNIHLEFIADSLGKRKSKKIFLAYFKVRNLLVDSLAQHDTLRPFYSDDIKLSIKNFTHDFRDSVNKMSFEEVTASTGTQSVQVYNFKITPKQNEEKFKDLSGFRKTRIDLYVKEADMHGVDFKKLFFEQKLYGLNIDIKKLKSDIYLNKLISKNPKKKVRFPTELVYDIRIPFYFKNVQINSSEVNYAENYGKNNFRWGIKFADLNGNIENFSNDTIALLKNPFANIKLSCNFNSKAKSNFEFVLDYLNPLKPFYVKGIISNYNLEDLNSITANLIHMEVANCNMRSLKFVINGDKKSMNANITLMYNNLRVKILEFDEEKNVLKKHGLLTILANHMVLEDQNPRKNGSLIKSRFELKRKEDWSFFAFIWKALLRGIKEGVGIDQRLEKELKLQAERYNDFKTFTQELRENRKLRREKRKQRKLAREVDKQKTSYYQTNDTLTSPNNY